jgi:hypothetical protein
MNSTLAYLRGRRLWVVESFTVWGTDSDAEFLLAVTETVDSQIRLGFWPVSLGGQQQDVDYSSLVDNKGNSLPETIARPAIIPVLQERGSAYIKSLKGNSGFRIAAADDVHGPVRVTLLIFETGAQGVSS